VAAAAAAGKLDGNEGVRKENWKTKPILGHYWALLDGLVRLGF
jgi:hypothetical protein